MLEKSLIESGERARARKPGTVVLSTALHIVVIVVLIVFPVVQPQFAPVLSASIGFPVQISKEADRPNPTLETAEPKVQPYIQPSAADFIEPRTIPADIALVVEELSGVML